MLSEKKKSPDVGEIVIRAVRKYQIGNEPIGPDETLEDLGLDSLDVVDLSLDLEAELGLAEVRQAELEAWKTIGDVIRFVEEAV